MRGAPLPLHPRKPTSQAMASPSPASSQALALPSGKRAKDTTEEDERMERRRKQCRISQRRYRDKKGSAEYNLLLDVNGLKETVSRLSQAKELLESRLWNYRRSLTGSVMKAVQQYYMVFRTGLHSPDAGATAKRFYDMQLGFLNAFMDPDTACCDEQGVGVVLEQWKRYTGYHASLSISLGKADIFGTQTNPIVRALGKLKVRLSRTTLENLFPHILADEELVQMLIGCECEYDTCTLYIFNEKNQVIRQDLYVDFVTAMQQLIGDSIASLEVMRLARIRGAWMLGENPEEEVDYEDWARGTRQKRRRSYASVESEAEEKSAATPTSRFQRSSRLDLNYIMHNE